MTHSGVAVLNSFWQLPVVYVRSLPQRFLTFLYLFDFFSGRHRHGFKQPVIWGSPILSWFIFLITKSLDLIPVWVLVDMVSNLLKPNKRALNRLERERLGVLFDHLPLSAIRIDEDSFLARLGKRYTRKKQMAVTILMTVHFTRNIRPNDESDMAWLCHELVHIAQMQSIGSQYIVEALYAQHKEGYAYTLDRSRLAHYNLEQQADIIREIFNAYTAEGPVDPRYQLFVDDLKCGRF